MNYTRKLKVDMTLDNQAFQDDPALEIRRILEEMMDKIDGGYRLGSLLDINGNKVGQFYITEEEV